MKEVVVICKPDGTVEIDHKEFSGADCMKATEFLKKALGKTDRIKFKPEFVRASTSASQRVGQ